MNEKSKFGITFLVGVFTGITASVATYLGYKELERKGKTKKIKKFVKKLKDGMDSRKT